GQEDRPFLTRAVAELGEGDLERGRRMLHRAALMLTSDDEREAAEAERFAVELGRRATVSGGLLSDQLRQDLAVRAAERSRAEVLSTIEPTVAERHTAVDLTQVRQAASELSAALLVDLAPDADD